MIKKDRLHIGLKLMLIKEDFWFPQLLWREELVLKRPAAATSDGESLF